MQASSSAMSAGDARRELTADMRTLMAYMLRSANVGTFNAIAELDLSFTQIKVLCTLESEGRELSVKALADLLGVSLPAMSRAVEGLVERELVSREEDPEDRRMKQVRLADAGHEVPRALDQARLTALHGLIDALDEEEVRALGDALALILAGHAEIATYRPQTRGAEQ